MAVSNFDPDKKVEYQVESDRVFDEKGSTFLSMRRIAWGVPQSETPDPKKVHLELRKWHMRDGKEMADKGFKFLTEDGPHELTKALIEEGFGHTKEILTVLKERDDFRESVETLYDDSSDASGDYFDPRAILLGE